ncbi:hypothetical protein ACLOJK_013271 [Asimina triloba]
MPLLFICQSENTKEGRKGRWNSREGGEERRHTELGEEEQEHDDGGSEGDESSGERAPVEILVDFRICVKVAELAKHAIHLRKENQSHLWKMRKMDLSI